MRPIRNNILSQVRRSGQGLKLWRLMTRQPMKGASHKGGETKGEDQCPGETMLMMSAKKAE